MAENYRFDKAELFNVTARKMTRRSSRRAHLAKLFTSLLWATYFYCTSSDKRSRRAMSFYNGNSGHADHSVTPIAELVKVSMIIFVVLLLRRCEEMPHLHVADAKNLSRLFARVGAVKNRYEIRSRATFGDDF